MPAQFGGDDNDLIRAQVDMAQQQRQYALTDTAKADDHEAAGKRCVSDVEHVRADSARGREAVRARADPVKSSRARCQRRPGPEAAIFSPPLGTAIRGLQSAAAPLGSRPA